MINEKKYRYNIYKAADGTTSGVIELTKEEASIVAYAFDVSNWKELDEELYSGSIHIDIDHPMEIK